MNIELIKLNNRKIDIKTLTATKCFVKIKLRDFLPQK